MHFIFEDFMKHFYFMIIASFFFHQFCLAETQPNIDPTFTLTQEQLKNKSTDESKNVAYFALLKFAKEKEQYYLKKYQITAANSPFNLQRFEESMKKKIYSVKSVNEINLFVLSDDISKRIAELFQPLALLKDYDSIMNSQIKTLEKDFADLKNEQTQILAEQKKITSTLNINSSDKTSSEGGLLALLKNNSIYINLSILVLQIILLVILLKK